MRAFRRVARPIAAAAAAVALALGCARPDASVVLVTFDTTRADHLGCYGHPRPTSPHIDALASRGVVFERAYAPMPQTLPSHATVLTGRDPREHGALHNSYSVSDEVPTLAEALRARGYATAAVVGSRVLNSRTGIERGFEHFDEPDPKRPGDRVTDAALAWADAHAADPFLLWVHYWDPHTPYEPPPHALAAISAEAVRAEVEARADELGGFGPELVEVTRRRRAYEAEIRFADEQLGRLLRGLEERGLLARTAVAMTSDHGEGLLEHGVWQHGVQLFEEAVRVPLVVAAPGGDLAGRRVPQPVALRVVAPILWQLATGESSGPFPGVDLHALVRGEARGAGPVIVERPHHDPAQLQHSQGRSPGFQREWGIYAGVVEPPHKLLLEPDGALVLYDLEADPEELRDLRAERPELAMRLRDALHAWLGAHPTPPPGMEVRLREDRRAWLEALGYLESEDE